jgi:hypothetical protein
VTEPEFVFEPVHVTEIVETAPGRLENVSVGSYACDFCLDCRVTWTYHAPDFVLPEIGFGSSGDWLACSHCAALIEAGDRAGLRARSEASWVLRGNPEIRQAVSSIGKIQAGFWKHHTGERTAFG